MTRSLLLAAVAVVLLGGGALAVSTTGGPRHQRLSTASKVAPTNPIAGRARPHLDHRAYFKEPMASGPEVTAKCLTCHPESAQQVMQTAHFTWLSGDVERGGETVRIGKRNVMNNFCIAVQGNWSSCTKCHAGYGWQDDHYDFQRQDNVDCLLCHDGSGSYVKAKS